MAEKKINIKIDQLEPFDRNFFVSDKVMSFIGTGSIGGKASGLAFIKDYLLPHLESHQYPDIDVTIPRFVVIATDIYDKFMERNELHELLDDPPSDDRIANIFSKAEFPAEYIGDLRGLISTVHTPLAIRSSSLLEDAMYEPFAGVYSTKMIPNNQPEIDSRFKRLIEAIKFVYASAFFKSARDYHLATGRKTSDEKMAVIIQEVVGEKHQDRFYPNMAGVGRSYNFYPMARANPEDGVCDLALGLGKTIVDGGMVWTYSPAYPRANPPAASPREILKSTQTKYWAVNMGKPPMYDPVKETEYLVECNLEDAEYDNVLKYVASTYIPADDRIVIGTGREGIRVVTFAPILVGERVKFNGLIKDLLELCENALESPVEIEFAMNLYTATDQPSKFGFLQVRPMVVSYDKIEISPEQMKSDDAVIASNRAMGNGEKNDISDIVFVDPDNFEPKHTRSIAGHLSRINEKLAEEGRHYLLIGFGRWGSSDPWLGTPVEWSAISMARAIVEATTPEMNVELSQGSHFFHNLSSFQITYFSVPFSGEHKIDWEWLKSRNEEERTEFVRHVRLDDPLKIKVDGRTSRGVILK